MNTRQDEQPTPGSDLGIALQSLDGAQRRVGELTRQRREYERLLEGARRVLNNATPEAVASDTGALPVALASVRIQVTEAALAPLLDVLRTAYDDLDASERHVAALEDRRRELVTMFESGRGADGNRLSDAQLHSIERELGRLCGASQERGAA